MSKEGGDLGSFEGKYPKYLFNKPVYANDGQTLIGYVAKETDDLIIVFSDSDSSSRFDIPKSIIALEGNSVIVKSETIDSMKIYKVSRELPLPPTKSKIEESATPPIVQETEVLKTNTRADALIEGARLQRLEEESTVPRTGITERRLDEIKSRIKTEAADTVSRISGLNVKSESILKNVRQAADEFRSIFYGAAKAGKTKVKYARKVAQEKKEEKDRRKILKMEDFAGEFTHSFDEVISEINSTRTYEEQERIYEGFLKLLEQQRKLVMARKDLASKLKGSITGPVLNDTTTTVKSGLQLQVPSFPSYEDSFEISSAQIIPEPEVKMDKRKKTKKRKRMTKKRNKKRESNSP